MNQRRRAPVLAMVTAIGVVIGVVIGVAGCATRHDAGGSASAQATTASPAVIVSSAESTPGRSPEGSGSPVPVVAGKVTVVPGATGYRSGVVISATIANGLDRTIYTEDFKTACTIAYLQRADGGTWTDILGCQLGRPTATVSIGPGTGSLVAFDPRSFHLLSGRTGLAFGAGRYRVKFTYALESDAGGAEPLTAYSAEFTIR